MNEGNMFAAGIAALFASEKYSDLTIECGEKSWRVHKTVVCTQSDYFARMVEGRFLEATTGVVNLQEDDPEDIERMICFLYHGVYDDSGVDNLLSPLSPGPCRWTPRDPTQPTDEQVNTLQSALTNVAMYALGEKYLIPHLKEEALTKFGCLVPENWKHGVAEVLSAVYGSTPQSDRGLRNPLVSFCQELGYQDNTLIKALDEVPDAHVDVLKEMLSAKEVSIVDLRSMVDNTSRAMEEDSQRILTLEGDRSRLLTSNARYQRENRRLRAENKALNETKLKADSDVTAFTIANAELEVQVQTLTLEKGFLEAEKANLELEKGNLESQNTNLHFRLSAAEARLTADPIGLNINVDLTADENAAMDDAAALVFPEIPFPADAVVESAADEPSKWSVESMINKVESGFCLHCGKEYNVYVDNGRTIYEPCCEACRSPLPGSSGAAVGIGMQPTASASAMDLSIYQ